MTDEDYSKEDLVKSIIKKHKDLKKTIEITNDPHHKGGLNVLSELLFDLKDSGDGHVLSYFYETKKRALEGVKKQLEETENN